MSTAQIFSPLMSHRSTEYSRAAQKTLDSRTASAREYLACTGPDDLGEARIIRAFIEEAWDPRGTGI